MITHYRELRVWQSGMELVTEVYQVTQSLPKSEIFGLTAQLQRAAVSIPANIAEGHARDSSKEYLHHLSFAMGSLAELETLLILTKTLKYSDPSNIDRLLVKSAAEGKMLRALQARLKERVERG